MNEYGLDYAEALGEQELLGFFNRADWREFAEETVQYAKEHDIVSLQERIEDGSFPRYGYTTAQVFESVEEYEVFKLEQIEEDYANEVENFLNFIEASYDEVSEDVNWWYC